MNKNIEINAVDICIGLNWGDEAKGKIVSHLAKSGKYDFVCRWAGGNNAGHTVYKNGVKYKTHLIPCGIFYDVRSIIGPGCVVNENAFKREIRYLQENGFNTDLIKISPKAHVITEQHIKEDLEKYNSHCSTAQGISPCYRDKYSRVGKQTKDIDFFTPYLWDEKLYGTILCEGAQGFWLDIDAGNYPYVTSSTTLPYGACSIGLPPQLIRNIYGASKIYDTRSGYDPDFPDSLLKDEELVSISTLGKEIGVTTGKQRKVNWLNLDKLIMSINISGATHVIISKIDILEQLNIYKLIHLEETKEFVSMSEMKLYITNLIYGRCRYVTSILFSDNVETINNL